MRRHIALALAGAICFVTPSYAEVISGPAPSAVGTAATGQIPGTTTNDNACATCVGAVLPSDISTPVSLTSATNADIATVALTGGDWDCWANISFASGGSTVATSMQGWINTTSATAPSNTGQGAYSIIGNPPTGSNQQFAIGRVKFKVASSATAYMTARSNFSVSTMTASGYLACERMR